MYTTILLSVLLTLALSAVVVLCIKLHKHNSNFLSPGEEITDSMIRKMLKEYNCIIIDDNPNPDWIGFQFDGRPFFIRVCGSYCEVHTGMRLEASYYNPVIAKDLCNNEMRHYTCGHICYDDANHGLLVTVFSINKTYRHLKASFYDIIQCVYYMFNTFSDLYHENANSREINNDNKIYS